MPFCPPCTSLLALGQTAAPNTGLPPLLQHFTPLTVPYVVLGLLCLTLLEGLFLAYPCSMPLLIPTPFASGAVFPAWEGTDRLWPCLNMLYVGHFTQAGGGPPAFPSTFTHACGPLPTTPFLELPQPAPPVLPSIYSTKPACIGPYPPASFLLLPPHPCGQGQGLPAPTPSVRHVCVPSNPTHTP